MLCFVVVHFLKTSRTDRTKGRPKKYIYREVFDHNLTRTNNKYGTLLNICEIFNDNVAYT